MCSFADYGGAVQSMVNQDTVERSADQVPRASIASPRAFGGRPDGSDQTSALRAALSAIPQAPPGWYAPHGEGGVLQIEAGTWGFSGPLDIPPHITVRGDG